jgi:hypothetical protein
MVGSGREGDIRTVSQVKLRRVEIISAKEPRRRWSDEEKRRLGTDVLGRINGHPASWLDELLPWNWKGRSARLIA